ncbi:hypothetical protein LC613_41070 [Nostoc sphaeroides CHAB 2801]|uniref:hypothetical protein n=1 Tax=Nostoc sphaeroides TaxID=446679 RepID=UPI001E3A475E|nr:hypothetical protein [Nostoc sphaeroides]MCC5633813.1 hypothetical protein [Nostoc sphaeroides CHAB 2801]
MNCSLFIKGISAAAATIICGYFGTQYLGRNIMYVISGAIVGTGITAFMVDRITGQNEIDQVMLRRPRPLNRPTSCIGCKYYHGISYNGSPLICSVHPEGIEGAKCPDWQSFHYLNKE